MASADRPARIDAETTCLPSVSMPTSPSRWCSGRTIPVTRFHVLQRVAEKRPLANARRPRVHHAGPRPTSQYVGYEDLEHTARSHTRVVS
jgi:hypothetical protein